MPRSVLSDLTEDAIPTEFCDLDWELISYRDTVLSVPKISGSLRRKRPQLRSIWRLSSEWGESTYHRRVDRDTPCPTIYQ